MGVNRLAIVLVAAIACGPAAGPTSSMRVLSNGPPNASVMVDDHFVGTLEVVTKRGVALPAGVHRVTVEATSYFPWDKVIEARGSPVKLDVRMVPVPE